MESQDDHILMVSRNGAVKPVPCWQIEMWIGQGTFKLDAGNHGPGRIGYEFSDESGKGIYEAWLAAKMDKEQAKKARIGPAQSEPTIAEAQFKVNSAPQSTGPAPLQELNRQAKEGTRAERIKPRDMLDPGKAKI
jgi:hypothetical protein